MDEFNNNETYEGGQLPQLEVNGTRKVLPYTHTDFLGNIYTINQQGKRIPFKGDAINMINLPADQFEKARLYQAKLNDADHYHKFGNDVRNFVAGLVMGTGAEEIAFTPITKGLQRILPKIINSKATHKIWSWWNPVKAKKLDEIQHVRDFIHANPEPYYNSKDIKNIASTKPDNYLFRVGEIPQETLSEINVEIPDGVKTNNALTWSSKSKSYVDKISDKYHPQVHMSSENNFDEIRKMLDESKRRQTGANYVNSYDPNTRIVNVDGFYKGDSYEWIPGAKAYAKGLNHPKSTTYVSNLPDRTTLFPGIHRTEGFEIAKPYKLGAVGLGTLSGVFGATVGPSLYNDWKLSKELEKQEDIKKQKEEKEYKPIYGKIK